jgi:hypothetical protein
MTLPPSEDAVEGGLQTARGFSLAIRYVLERQGDLMEFYCADPRPDGRG